MKKSSFFTFMFSLIPGAGQMYYGYMKRGVSVMTLFLALLMCVGFFHLNFIALFLPVVWFYSFFDTYQIRNACLNPETCPKDDFLFHLADVSSGKLPEFLRRRNVFLGGICIVFGAYLLYETLLLPVVRMLKIPILNQFFRAIPTLVVAVLIILLGIYLLRGGRPTQTAKDFQEFTGNPPQLPQSQEGREQNDN